MFPSRVRSEYPRGLGVEFLAVRDLDDGETFLILVLGSENLTDGWLAVLFVTVGFVGERGSTDLCAR